MTDDAHPRSHADVLVLTDTHIHADPATRLGGMATRTSFDAVFAAAGERSWDAILLTGDLAADGEIAAYQWLAERLGAVGVPVFSLPGNHDDPVRLRQHLRGPTLSTATRARIGGWDLVLCDTVVPGRTEGAFRPDELARLEAALAASDAARVLVALHHQPVSLDSAWMDPLGLTNAAEFWEVVDRYPRVAAVLWGHVHLNLDSYRGRCRLLATPSTCVQFTPRSPRFAIDRRSPAYRALRLHDDGRLDTEVVRVAAPEAYAA